MLVLERVFEFLMSPAVVINMSRLRKCSMFISLSNPFLAAHLLAVHILSD